MNEFERALAIKVGHPALDEQHQKMILLCQAVIKSFAGSVERKPGAAQLQALIDSTEAHFVFEERLMRAAAYPAAEQHAQFHASLLKELRKYALSVNQGRHAEPAGLTSFIWFTQHIEAADREFVAWLKSHKADGGS